MAARTWGNRLQTIDQPTTTQAPRQRPPWSTAAAIGLAIAAIPLLIFAIFNKWGVLVLVVIALTVGLSIWVWQRGLFFYEAVAFLIHFDGLGAGPIRMGRAVALVAGLLMIYKLVVQRWRPPALPLRTWAPVFVLLTWAAASGLWSAEALSFLNTMGQFMLGVVFFCITALMVDSHRALHKFLRAYWIGGLFGASLGILALFLGTRSVGFGKDPNFFGLLMASMIPLTVYYRRHAATVKIKWWYTFTLFAVLAGAAGAGSRSGLIGAAIALFGTMVTRPGLSAGRRSRVAIGALLLAVMAFGVGFIANPNNLERGFSDRGAGRLDFWTVTSALIQEQPVTGYGFGQLRLLISPNLLVTPGSQQLNEDRDDVSSHNTWMDVTGDLGFIGLLMFVSIFLMTMLNLLRPRWLQMKEISITLFVMLLPVLSSSMFLPLLNNKLAWAVIGLAAGLQVPSWRSRWKGMSGVGQAEEPQVGHELERISPEAYSKSSPASRPGTWTDTWVDSAADEQTLSGEVDRWQTERLVPGSELDPYVGQGSFQQSSPLDEDEVPLARWDLRFSTRARRQIVAAALIGGIFGGVVASMLPVHYTVTAAVIPPRLDRSVPSEYVLIDRERLQGVLTTVVSLAYAQELKTLSGVDLSVREISDRMSATRPKLGLLVQLQYSDTSQANVLAVQPYLVAAMDNIFENSRTAAEAQVADELRPTIPGEARYYSGAFYIRAYQDAVLGQEQSSVFWIVLVSIASAGLLATGLVMAGSRFPRVDPRDDVYEFTGLRKWTHVSGGTRKKTRSTPKQLEQIITSAVDAGTSGEFPSRIVVAAPRDGVEVRRLATGLAAACVADGRRVVLVDAQLADPALSARLARRGSKGVADLEAELLSGNEGNLTVQGVMRPVSARRLPREARQLLGADVDQLRFIPAGSRSARKQKVIDGAWLDQISPEVVVVVLAPPTLGDTAVSALMEWSDASVLAVTEGITRTQDAEDAAGTVQLFSAGAEGIVCINN
ncbi:lipid A core-O-antigen ligase-like enyme [Actinobacteria bacterium IMCC26207]|nr:lipid A core-O-antigen ligase-like enyme [Actinobacteria bacterium IMCC26207]